MLQRDANTQRLYLHNVVIEEETTISSPAIPLTTGADENNDYLFITNILKNALNVKHKIGLNQDNKLPVGEDTSPRALLANAFEGTYLLLSSDPHIKKSGFATALFYKPRWRSWLTSCT